MLHLRTSASARLLCIALLSCLTACESDGAPGGDAGGSAASDETGGAGSKSDGQDGQSGSRAGAGGGDDPQGGSSGGGGAAGKGGDGGEPADRDGGTPGEKDAGGTDAMDGGKDAGTPDAGTCGDGTRNDGEACDDGDDQDGDGCNVDCVKSGKQLRLDTYTFGGGDGCFTSVTADATGIAAVGQLRYPDSTSDLIVLMTEADGQEAFRDVLDGSGTTEASGGRADRGEDAVFLSDGTLVVAGYTYDDDLGGGPSSMLERGLLRRYDRDGTPRWTRDGIMDGRIYAVARDSEDFIYVGGQAGVVGWMRRYTKAGANEWTIFPDLGPAGCNGCDHVSAIGVGPMDQLLAVASLEDSDQDVWLANVNRETGDVGTPEVIPYTGDAYGYEIAFEADGAYRILGADDDGSFLRYHDGSGAFVWNLPSPVPNRYASMAGWPDGSVVLGHISYDAVTMLQSLVLTRLEPSGEVAWSKTYAAPDGTDFSDKVALSLSPSGRVLAAGCVYDLADPYQESPWIGEFAP